MWKSFMKNKFDLFFEFVLKGGLIFSIFSIIFSIYNLSKNISPTLYVLILWYSFFFTFGIIYFLLDKKIQERINKSSLPNYVYNSNKVCMILFYINLLLIIFILSKSLYVKPLEYYFLVSTATTIIGFQIVSKRQLYTSHIYHILFMEIIPLAVVIRASSFLINPYLIGTDVPWHYHFIENIIKTAFLDPLAGQYYHYPFYHLFQSTIGVLIGFSQVSFNLINSMSSVISILIVYSIGKTAFNSSKIGLMFSLLLSISTMHIFLAVFNTSKIGGTTLFLLCLLLMIKKINYNDINTNILFLISAMAILMWHPEISSVLLIILGISSLGIIFTHKKSKFNYIFVLYGTVFLSYIIYTNVSLFKLIIQNVFINEPSSAELVQNLSDRVINIKFLFQTSFAYLGITAPAAAISYMGFNILKKRKEMDVFLLLSLFSLYVSPLIGVISGNFGLSPDRALTYISLLVLLICAVAIFRIFNFNDKYNLCIFLILFFIFTFSSVSSYLIGDANNFYNDDIPRGTIFTTDSNLASYNYLNKTPEKATIVSDYETIRYTMNPLRGFLSIPHRKKIYLPKYEEGFLVINEPNLRRLNWDDSLWGQNIITVQSFKNKTYDNGDLMIFV